MNMIKILVLGDPGVGKTEILKLFCNDNNDPSLNSTNKTSSNDLTREWTTGCEVNVKLHSFSSSKEPNTIEKIPISFWDIGGSKLYSDIRSLFYKNINGIILIFDITSMKHTKSITKWLYDYCSKNLSPSEAFWPQNNNNQFQTIDEENPTSNNFTNLLNGYIPVLIIGNKTDIATKAISGSKNQSINPYFFDEDCYSPKKPTTTINIFDKLLFHFSSPHRNEYKKKKKKNLNEKDILKSKITNFVEKIPIMRASAKRQEFDTQMLNNFFDAAKLNWTKSK